MVKISPCEKKNEGKKKTKKNKTEKNKREGKKTNKKNNNNKPHTVNFNFQGSPFSLSMQPFTIIFGRGRGVHYIDLSISVCLLRSNPPFPAYAETHRGKHVEIFPSPPVWPPPPPEHVGLLTNHTHTHTRTEREREVER